MKKILSLLTLSPLALAACGGTDTTIEYRYDDVVCDGRTVTLTNFEIKYEKNPGNEALLYVKMKGMDAVTEYINGPYVSEDYGNWYSRPMDFSGSPTSCTVEKTEIRWMNEL